MAREEAWGGGHPSTSSNPSLGAYVSEEARQLRQRRFKLLRALRASNVDQGGGENATDVPQKLASAALEQLSFLYEAMHDRSKAGKRERERKRTEAGSLDSEEGSFGSVEPFDMHTKPFRIEAHQALICHLGLSGSRSKLQAMRSRLAASLKVGAWQIEGDTAGDEGDAAEDDKFLEGIFLKDDLSGLLKRAEFWDRGRPLEASSGRVLEEDREPDSRELLSHKGKENHYAFRGEKHTTAVNANSNPNPKAQAQAQARFTAPVAAAAKRSHLADVNAAVGGRGAFGVGEVQSSPSSNESQDRRAQQESAVRFCDVHNKPFNKWQQPQNNHQSNNNWQSNYKAYRKERTEGSMRRLAPSSEMDEAQHMFGKRKGEKDSSENKLDDENANEAPAGATMFTSAKQALCSNLSDPSKTNNYGHTMSEEKKQLLGWNDPNMYKRQRISKGNRSATTSTKGSGFVPPYLKKALEATGHNNGNNNASNGARKDNYLGGSGNNFGKGKSQEEEGEPPFSPKVMELLLQNSTNGELPEAILKLDAQLLEGICDDIMEKTGIGWSDIVGQEDAKRLVQEMVVWPMLNPNLFQGVRTPPKGLLLFGPPGTGKTLIGKAIASNIKATFFNISASSLTSKWIGEGEKMVRTLFTLAGFLQPAVIFIDEIDSILSARKSDGEHEASRRLKTEMLVQIEGCDPSCSERRVLIVGATNRPEELDEAARRRMPKQLYIPLPCEKARRIMIEKGVSQVRYNLSQDDFGKIVLKTKGYSGSDMKNFIQEACQGPVRDALAGAKEESDVAKLSEKDLRPVVIRDFAVASRAQRATVSEEEIQRYSLYNSKHGTSYLSKTPDDTDEW